MKWFINQRALSQSLPYWGAWLHLITREQSCSEKAINLDFFPNIWHVRVLFISADVVVLCFFSCILMACACQFLSFPFASAKFHFFWFQEKPEQANQEKNVFSKLYYWSKNAVKLIFIVAWVYLMFFFIPDWSILLFISPTITDLIRTAVVYIISSFIIGIIQ